MKNTVYNYNKRKTLDFEVPDYTSLYFGELSSVLNLHPEYFSFVDVAVDEKIENVSYQLYDSENYSDVILACNSENFLWGIPYNPDVLYEQKERIFLMLSYQLNVSGSNENFNELIDGINEKLEDINSKKKRWRVPKPEYLGDVIILINNYKKDHNDEAWRLAYELPTK